jgi:hypothetical protein
MEVLIYPNNHMTWQLQVSSCAVIGECMLQEGRQQAKVLQHHENIHVRNIGQGEALHRKYEYKRLKLGGDQIYGRSSD